MDCFYVVDTHGRILEVNDSYCSMTGYSLDELLSMNLKDIEAIETEEIIAQRMRRIIEVGWDRFETRHKCKDGRIIEIETSVNYVKDGIGKFFVFMRDITGRKQVEESLRESEEKYRSLVESTGDSIYLIDRNYRYLFMNKQHILRMGFSGNEYLGKEHSKFHSADETKWFIEKANNVFNSGESIHHEHKSLRDGRYFLQTLSPVKTSDGTIVAVTVVSKEITEYKRMEEKLRALSLIDELTGLHNRRGLFALVEQLLKLCNRQKKGAFMLYADVDNLKEINDTFGHKEGDMALKDIANILRKNFRDADIIARIGGDEFVVIPVGTAGDNVETISSRLQKSLEFHNAERNHSYKLSLSFGIAYYDPANPCSIDGLLIQGDELMYEQKKHKHTS
jgi:diguanylate cyclase (GGDEF)-like protein/PAS domain S-box-containing protein